MSKALDRKWELVLIVLILSVCLIKTYLLFFRLYPIFTPDSNLFPGTPEFEGTQEVGGYEGYADFMLQNRNIFAREEYAASAMQMTYMRNLGYPVLIALSKLIFGVSWSSALVVLQCTFSGVVSFFVYRMARMFCFSPIVSLFLWAVYVFGVSFISDFRITTDSAYTGFFILSVYSLYRSFTVEKHLFLPYLILSSFFYLCSFLLREASLYLSVSLVPLFIYFVYQKCEGEKFILKRMITALGVFLVPVLLVSLLMSLQSYQQTGRYIAIFGQQTALFVKPIELEATGKVDVWQYLSDTERDVAKSAVQHNTLFEIHKLNRMLHEKLSLKPDQILDLGKKLYFRLWVNHPLDMFSISFQPGEIFTFLSGVWMPFFFSPDVLNKFNFYGAVHLVDVNLAEGSIQWHNRLANFVSIKDYLFNFTYSLSWLVSVYFGFCFMIAPLILKMREKFVGVDRLYLLISCWGTVGILYSIYAIVHFEVRYLYPVFPLFLIVSFEAGRQFIGMLSCFHFKDKWLVSKE